MHGNLVSVEQSCLGKHQAAVFDAADLDTNLAMRLSQLRTRRSRTVRRGSKLAKTNTVLQSSATSISPSTVTSRPLLARTGWPSTETIFQSNSARCASQLATNSGSVAAAIPKLENSGRSRKATLRTDTSGKKSTSS